MEVPRTETALMVFSSQGRRAFAGRVSHPEGTNECVPNHGLRVEAGGPISTRIVLDVCLVTRSGARSP